MRACSTWNKSVEWRRLNFEPQKVPPSINMAKRRFRNSHLPRPAAPSKQKGKPLIRDNYAVARIDSTNGVANSRAWSEN